MRVMGHDAVRDTGEVDGVVDGDLVQQVRRHAEQVEWWTADVAASRRELERLEGSAARVALADPGELGRVTSRIAELRDRVAIGGQAVEEARRLEQAARAEALRGEADGLEPAVEAAAVLVSEFEERTTELLSALEKHTRQAWWPGALAVEASDRGLFAPGAESNLTMGVPFFQSGRDRLQVEVDRLRGQQRLLRAVADGGNASQLAAEFSDEQLPGAFRAGGFADLGRPSPERALVRQREGLVEDLESARGALGRIERTVAQWARSKAKALAEAAERGWSSPSVDPVAAKAWEDLFDMGEPVRDRDGSERAPESLSKARSWVAEAERAVAAFDEAHPGVVSA